MRRTLELLLVVTLVVLALSACGGGDVAEKPKQEGQEEAQQEQPEQQEEPRKEQIRNQEQQPRQQGSGRGGGQIEESNGENGKINFMRLVGDGFTIYEMNADGTGVTNLTDPSLATQNDPEMSPSGEKIAFTSPSRGGVRLYVMNADGTGLRRLSKIPSVDGSFVFSPDGKKIAFPSWANERDIFVINVDGTGLRRLTNMDGDESNPVWSRNGTKISFINTRKEFVRQDIGISRTYEMNADGTGITKDSNTWASVVGLAWSPDCKKIAFVRDNDKDYNYEDYDIYVRHADGQEVQITHDPAPYGYLVFSPGCKKIAFTSELPSSPSSSIYVINADGSGRKTTLTKGYNDRVFGWRSK